jgi:hypothetical protein
MNDFNNQDLDVHNRIMNEFDQYIQELMRRLQIIKEERKEAQNKTKILEHRLGLLKNQEKMVILYSNL